ncbi:hypothetical protein HDU93_008367 [Gonapodya sp. JEL0774]|nr:hypothetical protein HDU93_008367 [Gonapodya sp. JEL0774]
MIPLSGTSLLPHRLHIAALSTGRSSRVKFKPTATEGKSSSSSSAKPGGYPSRLRDTSRSAPQLRGIKLPRRFPTDWVFQQASYRHPASDFKPTLVNGVWWKPRVSLRNQARIRKVALLCGLDPVKDVGLPEKEVREVKVFAKLPEGKNEMKKYERQKRQQELLQKMPEMIATWKRVGFFLGTFREKCDRIVFAPQDRAIAKEKAKPDLDF